MIDSRRASACLLALAAALAAGAIALHWPGQVSMDTSIQLYEAHIGESVGWQPPFTSALMRWTGGGAAATAFLVLTCSLLTYLSLAVVAASVLRERAARGAPRIALWRAAFCAMLLLNPVLFVYVGIVWKDVLFSALLSAAVALSFVAAVSTVRGALAPALAAAALLALALQVRQQGVFMAPVLLLGPVVASVGYRGLRRARQALGAVAVAAVFVLALALTAALVDRSIAGAGEKALSVGRRAILSFDIAGTVARAADDALPVPISAAQRAAVRRAYSRERYDYLAADSAASAWLGAFTDDQLARAWWSLVRREPRAFLEHKWEAFASVLDLDGLRGCLPVHVGVDGNSDYLRAVGLAEGRDARDRLVYRIAAAFFSWPLYRHWYYLLALLAAGAALAVAGLPSRLRATGAVVASATGLLYLSFLPTAIACDFRYLFGAIPLVTMLWLLLLAGVPSRAPPAAAAPGAPTPLRR